MISKGSCDTEAENSALITGIKYILKCIQIENSNFKLLYFTMLLFLLYLWCIFQKQENLTNLKLLKGSDYVYATISQLYIVWKQEH